MNVETGVDEKRKSNRIIREKDKRSKRYSVQARHVGSSRRQDEQNGSVYWLILIKIGLM